MRHDHLPGRKVTESDLHGADQRAEIVGDPRHLHLPPTEHARVQFLSTASGLLRARVRVRRPDLGDCRLQGRWLLGSALSSDPMASYQERVRRRSVVLNAEPFMDRNWFGDGRPTATLAGEVL